jgi:hypothetical protein
VAPETLIIVANLERDFFDFLDFSFDLERERFFLDLSFDRDLDRLCLSRFLDLDLDFDLTTVLELDLQVPVYSE